MRYYFLLLLLAAWPLTAAAQPPVTRPLRPVPMQLDSQQAWLHRPGLPDTLRVAMLINVANLYSATSLDSARSYAQQAAMLSGRIGYVRGLAYSSNTLAAVCFYASDYPAAQRSFEASLAAARRLGQAELVGHAYLGLGNVAWELANEAASHTYYEQARQAYAHARPRLVAGELLVLHNSANNYLSSRQPARARPLIRQAQALLKLEPNPLFAAKLMLKLADVQQQQHQPDSAAATLRRGLALAQAAHLIEPEGSAMLSLARMSQARHQYPAALAHAQRASTLFRRLGDPGQLAEALRVQADALAALHLPGAYDTLSRYATLRDTLLTQERFEAVATAQARFDRAGQEARIVGLEKDRRIQHLESDRRATRTRLLSTGGALAASLLLAGIVWWYRRRQRRREAALRHQLAADLHDDLGPLLTQLAVESSLLRENTYAPAQLLARLQRLGHTSQQAAQHLGDVLRDLDQGPAAGAPAPLGELVQQLREQAHEALSPHELGLTFRLPDPRLAERLLPAVTRHALALIFREALHNVVKHAAGATLVQATLAIDQGEFCLTLLDDGEAPADTLRPGGRGLRNMQARAEALGGRCEAGPAPGGGYQVRACLPE